MTIVNYDSERDVIGIHSHAMALARPLPQEQAPNKNLKNVNLIEQAFDGAVSTETRKIIDLRLPDRSMSQDKVAEKTKSAIRSSNRSSHSG